MQFKCYVFLQSEGLMTAVQPKHNKRCCLTEIICTILAVVPHCRKWTGGGKKRL